MGSLNLKSLLISAGLGPKNLVGVDVGSSSIKVCELSGSKKSYALAKFAVQPLPEGSFFDDEVQKYDEVVEILKNIVTEVKPKSTIACIGVWGPNVISRRLQVGMGSMREIEDQVEWEFEQYIPFDIDDATVSFHFDGENKGGGQTFSPPRPRRSPLQSLRIWSRETGLTVKVVENSQFAIANAFAYVCKEELDGLDDSLLLLEFGANSTNVIIFRGQTVAFTRELSVGGQAITDEIQKAMGLSYSEAEDLKVNGDQSGNIPEEIVGIVNSSLDLFISEIKSSIDFYMASMEEKSFKCCYITGGSSRLPGLLERLKKDLKMEILFFNPFEKIKIEQGQFGEDFLPIISSLGVTALGLAMRSIQDD